MGVEKVPHTSEILSVSYIQTWSRHDRGETYHRVEDQDYPFTKVIRQLDFLECSLFNSSSRECSANQSLSSFS